MTMTPGDWITFIGVLIALCGVIASNIFVFQQIKQMQQQTKLAREQMQMNYKLSLRNKALSYSLYSNIHLRDARLRIEEYFGENLRKRRTAAINEIEQLIKKDQHLFSDIKTVLAHWENMALAMECDVVDVDVTFNMVGGTFVNHVKVFKEFIDDNKRRNPRAYYHLLNLSDKWEKQLGPTPPQDIEPVLR